MHKLNVLVFCHVAHCPAGRIAAASWVAVVAVALLSAPTSGQEELPVIVSPDGVDQAEPPRDPDRLGRFEQQFRDAQEAFEPITEQQLNQARRDLLRRMEEVERFVRPHTANGQRWLRYLRWDAFREALAEPVPPAEPIADTFWRLNRNAAGLERPQFRCLSDALRHYVNLLTLAPLDDPVAAYHQQLDVLADELQQYRERPTPELEMAIGTRLDFIAGLGQADELVFAIRREFARPNAFVNASQQFLNRGLAEPIHRVDPITDVILGTNIVGTAFTTGAVSVRTLPSADRARVELLSAGHVLSKNVGRRGPAVIHSTGFTDYQGTKLVELDDDAFRHLPAGVGAKTNSQIHSVAKAGGGLGSRLVSRIGWQRAMQNKGQADAIASRRAEGRISQRIDQEVGDDLRDARRQYEDGYRLPLARRGELPPYIRYSSTHDDLRVVVTQVGRLHIGAPSEPPPHPAHRDLVMRLHATAINNYASAILGGATVSETVPDQDPTFDVDTPAWMERVWEERRAEPDAEVPLRPFEPYSLTFRRDRPISVEFADGLARLTIHIARLISGDETFESWDVGAIFEPEMIGGGVVLRRNDELEVFPTGFDRERDRLSAREVALRANLTQVIEERSAEGRGFPRTIEVRPLEFEGAWARAGPLDLEQFISSDGWLTLAWHRR